MIAARLDAVVGRADRRPCTVEGTVYAGRIPYNVWAPGRPWHGATLSYLPGQDWRGPLAGYIRRVYLAEIQRAACSGS